jgi:glyceraldehyde 3-phosphate dehydrogenase
MALKIAINGFGRIGRTILKAGISQKNLKFVAINDLGNPENLAYLFKHDTAYGIYPGNVSIQGKNLIVGKNRIQILSEKDPKKLPWKKLGIDLVIESTGIFRTKEQAEMHLQAGAKKVIISAPAKGKTPVKTVVPGVNHETIKKTDKILSNASCTTNCLAPLVKVLEDNFGIENGFMTTIHGYTAGQALVDSPNKDLRRGRAAAMNIVPTTTGAASAIGLVVPSLNKKLNGIAIRVPIIVGSLTDLTVTLKKPATTEQINKAFREASKLKLKNILQYSEEELVSSDIINNPHACIFDSKFTKSNGKTVKILGWYDNEYGYCNQLIKLIKFL